METRRAAVYTRVSSEQQDTEDKTSLDEQLATCRAYASERGYQVVEEYRETASGTDRKRPLFRQMLDRARHGEIDTIVVWRSDRLGRGIAPAADLLEAVEIHDVQLEAVNDTIDRRLMGLMASIAGLEREALLERTRAGKRGAAKAGRIPAGQIAYGYRRGSDGQAEVDEYKAAVVRRMFSMCVEDGLGVRQIADRLTAEGVPNPSGGVRWWNGTVAAILRDETYTGTWFFGTHSYKTVNGRETRTKAPRDQWIGIDVPVLVDRKVWEKAQALKTKRKKGSGGVRRYFYLLSQMVTCSVCGSGFGGLGRVKEGGKVLPEPRRYYRCAGNVYHGLKCREHPFVRAEQLEALVWSQVVDVLTDPDSFHAAVGGDDRSDALDKDIAAAKRDLDRVQAEEDRLVRLFVSGQIDDAMLTRQRKFVTERLEAAQSVLGSLREQQRAEYDRLAVADSITAWAGCIAEKLDDLDDKGRRDVIRQVVETITLDGDNQVRLTFVAPVEAESVTVESGGISPTRAARASRRTFRASS